MKKIIKKSKFLYVILTIIALFFIEKTIYNTIYEKEINNLNNQLEEQQKIIDSLQINSQLFEDYYCSSENLFDTIFYHMTTDGTFVFEYEPYTQSSNSIWAYEELYDYLETKRNSWK
jgi:hypothetical protein